VSWVDYVDGLADPDRLRRVAKARLARARNAERLYRQHHADNVRLRQALRRLLDVVRDPERWDAGIRDEVAGIAVEALGVTREKDTSR
jgi:anti-sigma factor RsiW